MHEVLDLENQVVGKRAEQAEQRIVIGPERRHEIAHQRHHAGASGALLFIDRRRAAHNMTRELPGVLLCDRDAGFAQRLAEKRDQQLTARIQRFQPKLGCLGLQPQRRIGKTQIETLVSPGHRGARGQHHAGPAVEQLDQVIEPVGAARELLHRARDREPAGGSIVAARRQ